MSKADLILRSARLIDGTGGPSLTGDLAVTDDRIAAMGDLTDWRAGIEIDAAGLALTPGFIDSHCHDDLALLQTPLLEPKNSQDVTTVVNGNCGFSLAPNPPGRGPLPQPLASLVPDPALMFPDFAAYFARLRDEPAAVNSICLCGHTTLRHAAMDRFDRPATASEIATMRALLASQHCMAVAVCDGNGSYTGGASLCGIADGMAEMAAVWTVPGARRLGTASGAIRRLLRLFFDDGGRMVWLSAATPESHALYLRLGFRRIGTQVNLFLPA